MFSVTSAVSCFSVIKDLILHKICKIYLFILIYRRRYNRNKPSEISTKFFMHFDFIFDLLWNAISVCASCFYFY